MSERPPRPEPVRPETEVVAIYDEQGRPCGTAPRARVRAENLWHAATGIVVRNERGEVYVHRRTATKDVYPGRFDIAAGGVMSAGEQPEPAAERELAEELGLTGVPLTFVGRRTYADDRTRYHAFLYTVTISDEQAARIRHQPEEVDWGAWWTLDHLRERAAADPEAFMPDALALWPIEDADLSRPR